MASQIAHIIYAKKYLEKFPSSEIDKDQFFLGCVFPDAWRIDENISRSDTHLKFNLADLNFEGLSSFEAGWKFHCYSDMRREEILRNEKFYSFNKNKSEKWLHPAKMVEDQMLYDEYNNWEKLVHYFNNPPQIETGLKMSRESFNLWYAMVAKYFEKKPDDKSIHIFLMKQRGLPGKVDEIAHGISSVRENEKAMETLRKIAEEII